MDETKQKLTQSSGNGDTLAQAIPLADRSPEESASIWRNTDPRYSINKRADIVIIRPSIKGNGQLEAGMGYVDTKDSWSIWTPFENHNYISADDNWDTDWTWAWVPKRK